MSKPVTVTFECPDDCHAGEGTTTVDWAALLKKLGPVLVMLIQTLLASTPPTHEGS